MGTNHNLHRLVDTITHDTVLGSYNNFNLLLDSNLDISIHSVTEQRRRDIDLLHSLSGNINHSHLRMLPMPSDADPNTSICGWDDDSNVLHNHDTLARRDRHE